jgi:uncharacterized membrane protein
VPIGTPGAVTSLGTGAAALGGALVGVAWAFERGPAAPSVILPVCGIVALSGCLASLLESLAVGLGLRAPGHVRNVLTTLAGAILLPLIVFVVVQCLTDLSPR